MRRRRRGRRDDRVCTELMRDAAANVLAYYAFYAETPEPITDADADLEAGASLRSLAISAYAFHRAHAPVAAVVFENRATGEADMQTVEAAERETAR